MTGDYLQLYTNASGGIGYGAVCGPEWFFGTWPSSWLNLNITVLELYPIVAAVELWGRHGLTVASVFSQTTRPWSP